MEGKAWGIVMTTSRALYVPERWRRRAGAQRALDDILKPYPPGHVWRRILAVARVHLVTLPPPAMPGQPPPPRPRTPPGGAPLEHGCMEQEGIVFRRELPEGYSRDASKACQDALRKAARAFVAQVALREVSAR